MKTLYDEPEFVEKIGNLTEEIRAVKDKYDRQKEDKKQLKESQQKVIEDMSNRAQELHKLKNLKIALQNNVSPKKYYK
jgi:chromosome segregation ATPase